MSVDFYRMAYSRPLQAAPESGDVFDWLGDEAKDLVKGAGKLGGAVINGVDAALHAVGLRAEDIFKVIRAIYIGPTELLMTAVLRKFGYEFPTIEGVLGPFLAAAAKGDAKGMLKVATQSGRQAGDLLAYVPGVGTAASAALNSAITLLEGGGTLKAAIDLILAAPPLAPIPSAVKDILRTLADTFIELSSGDAKDKLTDLALIELRKQAIDRIPAEWRDLATPVIDAIINVVVRRVPIREVGQRALEAGIGEAVKKSGAEAELNQLRSAYDTLNRLNESARRALVNSAVKAGILVVTYGGQGLGFDKPQQGARQVRLKGITRGLQPPTSLADHDLVHALISEVTPTFRPQD